MITVNSSPMTWDDNGNLTNDEMNTYVYDVDNRLSSITTGEEVTSFTYNGLGDRLSQTIDDVTTNYTLDLNAGLTQVLTDGESTYLYGLSRLEQDGIVKEYFLGDALGSVRQMTDSTGDVTLEKSYTPFGEVLSSSESGESVYGYTGEVTDESGLVYLRARYYKPSEGRFITRDEWKGLLTSSQSTDKWVYALNNPINLTDPSGNFPDYCHLMPMKWMYAKCVLNYFHVESAGSIYFNGDAVNNVKGRPFCWHGPINYRTLGYIEGYSWFGLINWGGKEIVYDFATMESLQFSYSGIGISDSVLGAGYAEYFGFANGLRSDKSLKNHYMGSAFTSTSGLDISLPIDTVSLGFGINESISLTDLYLKTWSVYTSLSASLGIPYVDVGGAILNYRPEGNSKNYVSSIGDMMTDILFGRNTPRPEFTPSENTTTIYHLPRQYAAAMAMEYFYLYAEMEHEKRHPQ